MPWIGNQWYNPGEGPAPTPQQQRNMTADPGNTYVQGNQGLEGASSTDFANAMTSGQPWNMISSSPQGYNPAQYADPRFAQGLASNLGANVVNTRTIDSPAGSVPSQPMLDFGGGFAGNAGLIGQNFAKYGPEVAQRMLADEMRSSSKGFDPAVQNAQPTLFSNPVSTSALPSFTPTPGGPAQQVRPAPPNVKPAQLPPPPPAPAAPPPPPVSIPAPTPAPAVAQPQAPPPTTNQQSPQQPQQPQGPGQNPFMQFIQSMFMGGGMGGGNPYGNSGAMGINPYGQNYTPFNNLGPFNPGLGALSGIGGMQGVVQLLNAIRGLRQPQGGMQNVSGGVTGSSGTYYPPEFFNTQPQGSMQGGYGAQAGLGSQLNQMLGGAGIGNGSSMMGGFNSNGQLNGSNGQNYLTPEGLRRQQAGANPGNQLQNGAGIDPTNMQGFNAQQMGGIPQQPLMPQQNSMAQSFTRRPLLGTGGFSSFGRRNSPSSMLY